MSSFQEELADSYSSENQQHFDLMFCLSLFIFAIKIRMSVNIIMSGILNTSAFDYYLDQSAQVQILN